MTLPLPCLIGYSDLLCGSARVCTVFRRLSFLVCYWHVEKVKEFPLAQWTYTLFPSSLKTGTLLGGYIPPDYRGRVSEMNYCDLHMIFHKSSFAYWIRDWKQLWSWDQNEILLFISAKQKFIARIRKNGKGCKTSIFLKIKAIYCWIVRRNTTTTVCLFFLATHSKNMQYSNSMQQEVRFLILFLAALLF